MWLVGSVGWGRNRMGFAFRRFGTISRFSESLDSFAQRVGDGGNEPARCVPAKHKNGITFKPNFLWIEALLQRKSGIRVSLYGVPESFIDAPGVSRCWQGGELQRNRYRRRGNAGKATTVNTASIRTRLETGAGTADQREEEPCSRMSSTARPFMHPVRRSRHPCSSCGQHSAGFLLQRTLQTRPGPRFVCRCYRSAISQRSR